MRTDVVYRMTQADILECRVPQGPFGPCCAIVEFILETQFGITHLRLVVWIEILAQGRFDLLQFSHYVISVESINHLHHPAKIRTIEGVVGHGQER